MQFLSLSQEEEQETRTICRFACTLCKYSDQSQRGAALNRSAHGVGTTFLLQFGWDYCCKRLKAKRVIPFWPLDYSLSGSPKI
jgi:hypothetical protein